MSRQPEDFHTTDPILSPYLAATDERVTLECLTILLTEHAQPIIEAIIAAKFSTLASVNRGPLSAQDAADLKSESSFRLTRALQRIKNDPNGEQPAHFGGYVARTTYNVWNMYLRRSFPERARLKNRIRYLARRKRAAPFAMWSRTNEEMWIAFAAESSRADITLTDLIATVQQQHQSFAQDALEDLAKVIIEAAGGALRLDDLVAVIAEVWGLKEPTTQALDEVTGFTTTEVSITQSDVQWRLAQLWPEIRELLPLQRAALLLNLRDERGRDLTAQLLFTRVASPEDLAAALGVDEDELLELLRDLPLDDNRIALRLRLKRQQVINLRRCARDRLWRRLRGALSLRRSRERKR